MLAVMYVARTGRF